MAEQLKNNYNRTYINSLNSALSIVHPKFDEPNFTKYIFASGWKDLELKQRMERICLGLHKFLPKDYRQAVAIILDAAPPFGGFEGMFFPQYIEKYGQHKKYKALSRKALTTLTQYSSSEFAIRPFILNDPVDSMVWIEKLSQHKNYHVRRLASEGCRPRLPWAQALPVFKKDPTPILPILTNLKGDPELYVRRSVANNINDITKDNPDTIIKLIKQWRKETTNNDTEWVIQHGLRSLVKQGHPDALKLLGFAPNHKVEVSKYKIDRKNINLGQKLGFEFQITNTGTKKENLVIDYAIYHMKKNGELVPKVFKLAKKSLNPNQTLVIGKNHNFREINTRTYHSGKHEIEIQINGKKMAKKTFVLNA